MLSLTAGVRLDTSGSAARVVGRGGDLVLGRSSRVVGTLRNLMAGRSSHRQLESRALARDGLPGMRLFHETLARLIARGWLAERVSDGDVPIVSAIPLTAEYQWDAESARDRAYTLSRFAFMRRDEGQLVLESPTARARVVLHDHRALILLWRLSKPGRISRARAPAVGLPWRVVRSTTDLLWRAGFLTASGGGVEAPADESPPLIFWEFHDLLFHSRTRLGRHASPYGATYRLEGRVTSPPVFETRPAGRRIPLFRPDIARLSRTDWPLTRTLEARRSRREHGNPPMTRRQLAEFLYRTAAVRSVRTDRRYATTRRVYPSGGAAYALELYVAVSRCQGLAPGLYHYGAGRHDLRRMARMTPAVEALLAGAARAARADRPQVLIVIAARFLRTAWKYSSISYALILKDVGALMQTMYLVATAMGLAACAIGGGDADLFANAAGTNYYAESSVGEFILGRMSPTSR